MDLWIMGRLLFRWPDGQIRLRWYSDQGRSASVIVKLS